MTSALSVAKEAIRLWRQQHGNESLYMQCQRYDGYYWQWAYQGNTNIHTYASAKLAANASTMFTKEINSASIKPGDLLYWDWDVYGHVGTVVGRQNGRTLVTHTGTRGADVVADLGNGAKVSHADTIDLKFIGASHTNGKNSRRTGLTPWPAPKKKDTEEAEVVPYHKQDRKKKTIKPKQTIFATDSKGKELNLVGGIGEYIIMPHLYVDGLAPGDVVEIKLAWVAPNGRKSWHYIDRPVADRHGMIRRTTAFSRAVPKGYKVVMAAYAGVANKKNGTITLMDADSMLFKA